MISSTETTTQSQVPSIPLSTSPAQKDAAFKTVVEEEDLYPCLLTYAQKVFHENVELANEYFGSELKEARALWLQDELERVANSQIQY